MQKKLVMLFIAILLAFVILVGRITYINATSGSKYRKDRGTRKEKFSSFIECFFSFFLVRITYVCNVIY